MLNGIPDCFGEELTSCITHVTSRKLRVAFNLFELWMKFPALGSYNTQILYNKLTNITTNKLEQQQ